MSVEAKSLGESGELTSQRRQRGAVIARRERLKAVSVEGAAISRAGMGAA
jgi:hypothetical protein